MTTRHAEIIENAPLDALNTFGLKARARELARLEHPDQLEALMDTPLPVFVLGGGSNTLILADFPGRVILNRLAGIESEVLDRDRVRVTAGAGENWHALVRWSLERGLWGLENLAMIPGLVGAAPMQNIGAYGVELAHCLEGVEVFDRRDGRVRWLKADECGLGYRTSRFREADAGRFIILSISLVLEMHGTPVTDYPSLVDELRRIGQTQPDARTLAAAVMRVRRRKLPDPSRIANAGSFFRNPVVPLKKARALLEAHPELPTWPDSPGRVKLSAAWMIDALGWRGKRVGDAAVYEHHALVLVNLGQARAEDLLELGRRIRASVRETFGVELEPEPVLLGGKL